MPRRLEMTEEGARVILEQIQAFDHRKIARAEDLESALPHGLERTRAAFVFLAWKIRDEAPEEGRVEGADYVRKFTKPGIAYLSYPPTQRRWKKDPMLNAIGFGWELEGVRKLGVHMSFAGGEPSYYDSADGRSFWSRDGISSGIEYIQKYWLGARLTAGNILIWNEPSRVIFPEDLKPPQLGSPSTRVLLSGK